MERNLISTCQVCDCHSVPDKTTAPMRRLPVVSVPPPTRHGIALITCQW